MNNPTPEPQYAPNEAMARLRSIYEKHLTDIKSYRRTWAAPRAYLSRLPAQNALADKLAHDLRDAGVYIVEKSADIKPEDFIIILDTPAYHHAYQANSPELGDDPQTIQTRLAHSDKKVRPLACEGHGEAHSFKACRIGDFCDATHYPVNLFNLILDLYAIPLDHKGFEPLRWSLHEQWEHTLAGKEDIKRW